jgi:hypothetical protein
MVSRIPGGSIAVCALLIASGCATAPEMLQRNSPNATYFATDSRLRVIASVDQGPFSTIGSVEAKRITCTEPSPDVATTIANSLGVGLGLFGKGSASLSAQQVEGLVQLGERTAAIQLLRDKMYQTCLAFSNGAITGTTYSLIMSRLDDAIITLSLGDNAAGAFGRKLAGAGGEASAKADAAVAGLSAEAAKIEEQAGKLAAANKKVDDAADNLKAHKATKPAEGKEADYGTQTTKLEKELADATAQRNALLELLRSTAKATSEASGKISQLQTGGGITSNPNAFVLREMQGDFLTADSSRDLIYACMVELGLRGDGKDKHLDSMTKLLEDQLKLKFGEEVGVLYAGAIMRGRGTALGTLCASQLPALITDAATKSHEFRMLRAKLGAENNNARFASDGARAKVRELELLAEAIKLCNTEFKDDAARKKACLDRVVPVEAAAKTPAKEPAKEPVKEAAKTPAKDPAKTPAKAPAKTGAKS